MNSNRIFDQLGVMADCSRNSVMSLSALKKLAGMLAAMGYNTLQLYTEDTYEVDGEPYFGYLRGRYTKTELKELDAYAAGLGIELIPCIQTLAHLNQIFCWPEYRPIRDCGDILLAGEERTYQLIDNIFSTLAECFTSRRVHIGMDEAHMLGLGSYLDKHGYENRHNIMLKHLERVLAIAGKYGFRCMMWSDMFFILAGFGPNFRGDGDIPADVRARIPQNVDLIYWDYYSFDKANYDKNFKRHKTIGNHTVFAGGVWTWTGITPHNRSAIGVTEAAFESCREHGIREAFLTAWGDNGGSCSPFSALPALFWASELAKGNQNPKTIKRKFEALTGVPFDVFSCVDLPDRLYEDQPLGWQNPSKYLFYNDCLLGRFDSVLERGVGDVYKSHARKLKRAENYSEWAFLFKPLRLLCEALYYKADLGVRMREAYRAGDRAALAALVSSVYKPLIKKIKEFYQAFAAYWDTLFKPHGFDVMDLRIGGLLLRLEHISAKLLAYASGKTDKIAELDEELLDIFGGGKAHVKNKVYQADRFADIYSVNVV
ncbi:MAG: beta-N-acetylhexosaminidase [Firmicutes bacterium]|nr:beta-N-acetylhexosaminidase [Bacillota bacterium]